MDQECRHLAVIGLGSVLMGDDAAGPYFVNLFEANHDFPPELTVVDLGTPGPELSHYLLEWEKLIVVDTIKTAGDPGEVHLYRRDEILEQGRAQHMSPHDPSLKDALLTADFVGGGPQEVLLVGVIPQKIEMGTELSTAVKEALPRIETAVLDELCRWGITSEKKAETQNGVWWGR